MKTPDGILGIDMGGSYLRGGLVNKGTVSGIQTLKLNNQGTSEEVLNELFYFIDQLVSDSVTAIGIGVPGLVDEGRGLVYDLIKIPLWKEVPLIKLMEDRYHLPVRVNNDANCFALGEFYFGKGQGCNAMVGLTIGTGLGSGIILNNKLYAGANCGAGEFGMIKYLDDVYEYYASGQFFENIYHINGEVVFKLAAEGNPDAIQMYREFGTHLGNAIKMIMYSYDMQLIVLGGSVRIAWPYFHESMWEAINSFAYPRSVKGLKIMISELENSGVLGAASLHYDITD